MVLIDGSVVQMISDPDGAGVDITNHGVISSATFNVASNATPGDMDSRPARSRSS